VLERSQLIDGATPGFLVRWGGELDASRIAAPSTGRYFTIVDEFQFFRVESQGEWTIETADASLAAIPVWSGPSYSGSGNDVLRYTGEPGLLGYSEADDPNIVVRAHDSDNGLSLVAVEAEGEWTLTMELVR
jgi:hypothetical protein